MMVILPFQFSELPIRKTFTLPDGKTLKFELRHNSRHDFFTLSVYNTEDALLFTTKLCYLRQAIHAVVAGLEGLSIVPYDFDNDEASHPIHDGITSANFDRVRLVAL
jgi:hypothetical protein